MRLVRAEPIRTGYTYCDRTLSSTGHTAVSYAAWGSSIETSGGFTVSYRKHTPLTWSNCIMAVYSLPYIPYFP